MESLQDWGLMGGISINSGFYWGSNTGIYCDILGRVCDRLAAKAFCKGIVSTARRGGLPFAPAKGSKTGQRGTGLSPLQTPLTLNCAGYGFRFFSVEKSKSVLHADGLKRCL